MRHGGIDVPEHPPDRQCDTDMTYPIIHKRRGNFLPRVQLRSCFGFHDDIWELQ